MTTGMLWHDASRDTLENKVIKAMSYYIKKYGVTPDLCLVHTFDYVKGDFIITVRPYKGIVKNHLWIGVEDE